jgi:hypothetical protein
MLQLSSIIQPMAFEHVPNIRNYVGWSAKKCPTLRVDSMLFPSLLAIEGLLAQYF